MVSVTVDESKFILESRLALLSHVLLGRELEGFRVERLCDGCASGLSEFVHVGSPQTLYRSIHSYLALTFWPEMGVMKTLGRTRPTLMASTMSAAVTASAIVSETSSGNCEPLAI